jgi:hypothetical protein
MAAVSSARRLTSAWRSISACCSSTASRSATAQADTYAVACVRPACSAVGGVGSVGCAVAAGPPNVRSVGVSPKTGGPVGPDGSGRLRRFRMWFGSALRVTVPSSGPSSPIDALAGAAADSVPGKAGVAGLGCAAGWCCAGAGSGRARRRVGNRIADNGSVGASGVNRWVSAVGLGSPNRSSVARRASAGSKVGKRSVAEPESPKRSASAVCP